MMYSTGGIHFSLPLKLMSKNFVKIRDLVKVQSLRIYDRRKFASMGLVTIFAIPDLVDLDRDSDLLDRNPSSVIALDDTYKPDSNIHLFCHNYTPNVTIFKHK